MPIPVKLEVFEGPLDLLLHLIDKNKLDIYDIPIVIITDQYMEYVNAMEHSDMNVVSEFMVMAATLLDIKSRMLLPKEETEDGEEIDPRDELVQKLLEYKMYKFMSFALRDLEDGAAKVYFREENMPKEIKDYKPPVDYEELIGDTTLAKLNEIFRFVMKRQDDKIDPVRSTFGKIEKEDVDMDAKQLYVEDYLHSHRHCSFRQLLQKQGSKMEVIVTFMLILEMMKTGKITIRQDHLFDDILIDAKD